MFQIIFKSLALLSIFLTSCAELDKNTKLSARGYFKKALFFKKKKNYSSALNMLDLLDEEKSYTKYASLSKLLRADIYYKKGMYKEALEIYMEIKKVHPNLKPTRVLFKIGLCHLQKTPLRADTDLLQADTALSYFNQVVSLTDKKNYYRKKAERHILFLLELKSQKELKVAAFYKKQNQNQAALLRLESLIKNYPKSSLLPQALLMAYEVSVEIEKPNEIFKKRLLKEFPKSKEAIKLKNQKGTK